MKQYNFVVVDIDAGTTAAERLAYAQAQQDQVNLDFGPAWEFPLSTVVRVASSPTDVKTGEVEVRLIDKPTMDGAIGYHDQKPDGTPIIYVFVGLAKQLGEEWTVCASHEVLEVLGDPRLRLCVELGDGTIWDHEVCDRVESLSYKRNGVSLSNFNTPQCFEPDPTPQPGVKYDFMGASTAPNQTLAGGYSQQYTTGQGWSMHQVGAMSAYRKALLNMGIGRVARRQARNPSWFQRVVNRIKRLFKR